MVEVHIEKEGSRLDDYDFKECMKYAPFKIEEVEDIIACVNGEADGPSWHFICKLKDGRYGYVTGSCDYTGWGCQESGDGNVGTLEEVLEKAPEEDGYGVPRLVRATLKTQIEGTQPYGLTNIE